MKILIGVIDKLEVDKVGYSYKEKLQNLTDFWLFNSTHSLPIGYSYDIKNFSSEQECLNFASTAEYDYVIGTLIGHLLRPGNSKGKNVIVSTVEQCSRANGLVGHIIAHPGKVPYLYDEYWCIDLNKFKQIGIPNWEIGLTEEFPQFNRSEGNFHNDYTPFYLEPGNALKTTVIQELGGTGLISKWLDSGLKIENVSKEVRDLKHHLYPEVYHQLKKYLNSEITVDELDQELQIQYFKQVDYSNAKDNIFLFNTDRLDFKTPKTTLTTLVSVCAAFRPYLILFRTGFDNKTVVKFIDYSKNSLMFKKWLLENWDGSDIFEAITTFENYIGKKINWNKPFHLSYQEAYLEVIKEFGSKEKWLEFWREYRKLEHEFHLVDLVENPLTVEYLIDKNQTYLYISNSFNTEAGLIKHGRTKLLESFNSVIKLSKEANLILDSSDIDHHYPEPDFIDKVLPYYTTS